MTTRTNGVHGSVHMIISRQTSMHKFPYEKENPRDDARMPNEVASLLFWGSTSKMLPRGSTREATI